MARVSRSLGLAVWKRHAAPLTEDVIREQRHGWQQSAPWLWRHHLLLAAALSDPRRQSSACFWEVGGVYAGLIKVAALISIVDQVADHSSAPVSVAATCQDEG